VRIVRVQQPPRRVFDYDRGIRADDRRDDSLMHGRGNSAGRRPGEHRKCYGKECKEKAVSSRGVHLESSENGKQNPAPAPKKYSRRGLF
jgi:hypothetical protein